MSEEPNLREQTDHHAVGLISGEDACEAMARLFMPRQSESPCRSRQSSLPSMISPLIEVQLPGFAHSEHFCKRRAPCKGGAFQWVQAPPGQSLQPEATGAVMEVTK